MSMSLGRIKYLRDELEAERISMDELREIRDAFDQIPDDQLRDERSSAITSDMLDELEAMVSPVELEIYDWVVDNFGEEEANEPSWDIGQLVAHLEEKFEFKER